MPAKKNNNDTNVSSSQNRTTSDNNSQQQRQANKEKSNANQRIGGNVSRSKGVRISRSQRAGVVFPVNRIRRILQEGNYSSQIRNDAAVFMAGVLEYLVAEVTELAGNAARENKRHRLTPRHIFLGIHNDEELNKLCQNVTIAAGGVMPHLHEVLLQSKRSSQSSKGKTKSSPKKQGKSNQTNGGSTGNRTDDEDTMEE